MKKSLSSEQVLKKIQEDMEEVAKEHLFKPVTQSLVNTIRYQINQLFISVSEHKGYNIQEHIGFEVTPSKVDKNKMNIQLYPKTEYGEELLSRLEEEYGEHNNI